MKTGFLRMLIGGVALCILCSVAAYAQAGANFVVNVPFAFTVAGKTLPAGEYVITRSTQSLSSAWSQSCEGLRIQSRNNNKGVYLVTVPVSAKGAQQASAVVFRRYGGEYFLFQVWVSGRTTGRELHKSQREVLLARELKARSAETISVAANKPR